MSDLISNAAILWANGRDTLMIARALGVSEARIYNVMNQVRRVAGQTTRRQIATQKFGGDTIHVVTTRTEKRVRP